MVFLRSIGRAILKALENVWDKLISYLPNLIAGIIVLIIGIIVAKAIAKLVQKIVEALKVDELFRKINIIKKIEEAGTKVVLSQILGWLVQWFLYVVILVAVSEILMLGQFTKFLTDIALYLPNVIIAALILVVGVVLGDFVNDLLVRILKSAHAKTAALAGALAKWSIIVFTVLAALIQLKVAVSLVQMLFSAIVIMLALAFGLAFGLGGKDAARDFIDKIKRDIA